VSLASNTSHVIDVEFLADCIERRKELLGITWREVAAEVGVTNDALWRIRHLSRVPRGDTLVSIMVWLGTSDIWAFTAERAPAAPGDRPALRPR